MECRCFHVYALRYTLFPIYFRSMTTISNFKHTQAPDSIPTSLSVLLDLDIVGIAVGMSLYHIYEMIYMYFKLRGRHLVFFTYGFFRLVVQHCH